MVAVMKPKVETIIAMRISVAPVGPANCTAAAASGALAVSGAARALPRMPWATSWTAMYSTPTPVTARAIARGTARAASRTSPLTCSADSIPKNANIRSNPDSPRRESEGNDPNARFSARTCGRPGAGQRAAKALKQPADGVGENGGDGAHGERDAEPEQHAAQEPRVGAERRPDVRVWAAALWDAAAGLCDAEGDERRRHGAHEVGEGSGGTEAGCHVRGEHEDCRADSDVEDRGGEPTHTNDSAQAWFVGGRRR